MSESGQTPRCWECGETFDDGTGYGESQVFCSEPSAETFKHSLGA